MEFAAIFSKGTGCWNLLQNKFEKIARAVNIFLGR